MRAVTVKYMVFFIFIIFSSHMWPITRFCCTAFATKIFLCLSIELETVLKPRFIMLVATVFNLLNSRDVFIKKNQYLQDLLDFSNPSITYLNEIIRIHICLVFSIVSSCFYVLSLSEVGLECNSDCYNPKLAHITVIAAVEKISLC